MEKKGYQFKELLLYLEKHPDQYNLHSYRSFLRNAIRGLVKELPKGFIDFGGKGTIFKMIRIYQSLEAAWEGISLEEIKKLCPLILPRFLF